MAIDAPKCAILGHLKQAPDVDAEGIHRDMDNLQEFSPAFHQHQE